MELLPRSTTFAEQLKPPNAESKATVDKHDPKEILFAIGAISIVAPPTS
jgi:hypothetical protein